jgi:hypothetical protein
MKTKFTLATANLSEPVVFQDKFNDHSQTLNATQSWSLFFTGGKSENSLGSEPVMGRAATAATVAIAAAGVLSSVFLVGVF